MKNAQTKILSSYYLTFSNLSPLFNYQVLRGGHIITASGEHHIKRKQVSGHEFILCLNGKGNIKINNRVHHVSKGHLAWIPLKYPHEHYPNPHDPWEIYWIRVKGGNLDPLLHFLNIENDPVFQLDNDLKTQNIFTSLFAVMDAHNLMNEAIKDQYITKLIKLIISNINNYPEQVINDKRIRTLVNHIQNHYMDEWDIDKLTQFCNLSKSQLNRVFMEIFDVSPIKWIKQYRLSQAQYLLVKTQYSISDVAFEVGYKDPLHFSRGFKRFVGLPPSAFRIQEQKNLL